MITKNILPILLCIGFPVLLVSCSDEEDNTVRREHGTAIVPTATLNIVQTSSRVGELSGLVSGPTFPKDSKNVFAITAYKGDAVPTTDYNITYFHNEPINSSGGEMLFNIPQYYPNREKLYFYAYSPVNESNYSKGDATRQPSVTFNIANEPTDILWAKQDKGIAIAKVGEKQEQPSFVFKHKLQLLQFKFVKVANSTADYKVTQICVTGNPTHVNDENNKTKGTAILNLINGNITYEGENKEHKLKNLSHNVKSTDDAKEIDKYLLTRPIKNIKLTITYDITNSKGTTNTKTFTSYVTLEGAETDIGGKRYLLTIDFLSKSVVIVYVEKVNGWKVYNDLPSQDIK